MALALAPAVGAVPGAVVLRSDEVRKRLFGVSPLERLGPEGYTSEVSRGVYGALADQAAAVVRAGYSAIVDAVYAKPTDRAAIENVAAAASVPFLGVWLDALESVLIERTQHRVGDPSDANADVVRMQLIRDTGAIGWHRIDGAAPAEAVLREAFTASRVV